MRKLLMLTASVILGTGMMLAQGTAGSTSGGQQGGTAAQTSGTAVAPGDAQSAQQPSQTTTTSPDASGSPELSLAIPGRYLIV